MGDRTGSQSSKNGGMYPASKIIVLEASSADMTMESIGTKHPEPGKNHVLNNQSSKKKRCILLMYMMKPAQLPSTYYLKILKEEAEVGYYHSNVLLNHQKD